MVMVAAFLLSTLFLAVDAQPISALVKLSFAKHVCIGTTDLVKDDQLRVKTLEAKARGLEVISSTAKNRAIFYLVSVGMGSPATYCE
jgi:hypothetical protein